MRIDERLKQLRTAKGLTQSDIDERTGLSRTYVSAVENGHTVPALETLEKFARALEVPMYVLFYDGMEPPKPIPSPTKETMWGDRGKDAPSLARLRPELGKMSLRQRELLLDFARKLASRAK
jgi:transcriptional regulator with XRE-family HTH domain